MLQEALLEDRFVVTAELGPPACPDADAVRTAARALHGLVDGVNVTDNQAATVKMSPLACCSLLLGEGLEPILQLTARDRNLMALQADLIGACAFGVRCVLALGGDPLKVGPYAELATHVGDVDAAGMTRMIVAMNEGRLAAGERMDRPTSFLVAGAANPLVDTIERLEAKLDAGVALFQSNVVYDVQRFAAWFAPLAAAGVTERAPFLIGVMPPRSEKMLRHMHDNIPGIEVDDATFARMEGLTGEAAREAGIEIARDVIDALREVPGVSGVHVMAPGWEAVAVPRLLERTRLTDAAAAV